MQIQWKEMSEEEAPWEAHRSLGLLQRNYRRVQGHLIQPHLEALSKRSFKPVLKSKEGVCFPNSQFEPESSSSHFTFSYSMIQQVSPQSDSEVL